MTHTPGPWEIVSRFVGPLYIVADVSTAIDKSGKMEIAHVGADTFATAQANARLIAAAPELLDALELARWFVENFPTNALPDDKDFVTPIEKVSAAIAKARGTT